MSEEESKPIFKKRVKRPQPRQREPEDIGDEAEVRNEAREGSEGLEEEEKMRYVAK